MKKRRLQFSVLALSLSLLAIGCNKSDNNNTTNPNVTGNNTNPNGNNNNNNNNNNTGNNNNNNNNNSNQWNWSGTAPLSVKINGVLYQATHASASTAFGILSITASNSSDTGVSVSVPASPTANTAYNVPSPANVGFYIQSPSGGTFEGLAGGGVMITGISTTSVQGLFYATAKDPTNSSSQTYTLTEGYFNVNF